MKLTLYLLGGTEARLDVDRVDWPLCKRALAGDGVLWVDDPDGSGTLIDPHVLCWRFEAGGESS
jgi:hypothetical protein